MTLTDKTYLNGKLLTNIDTHAYETKIIHSEYGSAYWSDEGLYFPLILFYNEPDNCYYYLKIRTARYKKHLFSSQPSEILVKNNPDGFLGKGKYFYNSELYANCSQLYKINADYLISLLNWECEASKVIIQLEQETMHQIIERLWKCLEQDPPYFSWDKIVRNSNGKPVSRSLYLCDQKFKRIEEKVKRESDIDNFEKHLEHYKHYQTTPKRLRKAKWLRDLLFKRCKELI